MSVPNIYNMFRFLVTDYQKSSYDLPDFALLTYLDSALEKLSMIAGLTKRFTGTVQQSDIDRGYFTVANEIIAPITTGGAFSTKLPYNWQLAGGNRISFKDPTLELVGTKYDFFFKVKFKKFNGVLYDSATMDLPTEAELPVVIYALGVWLQEKNLPNADSKAIQSKAEDGLSTTFGIEARVIDFTPQGIMSKGIQMMTELSFAQDSIWSVKI